MITDGDSYRRRHARHHKSPALPRVSVVVLPISQRGMLWLTWWRATSLPSGGLGPTGRGHHIKTWQRWLHLATVIDCFNKAVIGYAMADHIRTERVTRALEMAVRNH